MACALVDEPFQVVPAGRPVTLVTVTFTVTPAGNGAAAAVSSTTATTGPNGTDASPRSLVAGETIEIEIGPGRGGFLFERAASAPDALVLECSSFQLEDSLEFSPEVAAFLNLGPDHLDRHGDLDSYREAKLKIFANQVEGDVAVLNADDPASSESATAASVIRFTTAGAEGAQIGLDGDEILVDGEALIGTSEMQIIGRHNVANAMAGAASAIALGLSHEEVAAGLRSFPPVAHRYEPVAEIEGVVFINDSKATNADAAAPAPAPAPAPASAPTPASTPAVAVTPVVPPPAPALKKAPAPKPSAPASVAAPPRPVLASALPEPLRSAVMRLQVGGVVQSQDRSQSFVMVGGQIAREGAAVLNHTVASVMTRNVVCCTPEDSVESTMALMTERRFRHLPVRSQGRIIGMISIGDVVKRRVEDAEREAASLREYIVRG